MRRTKVAFFSDILKRDFDGANRTMFHIIDRIPKENFEYLYIYGEGKIEEEASIDIPHISIPFQKDYSLALPITQRIKKTLDKFRPDVIHIASPSWLGNYALDYARPRAIPTIAIYHTHFISYVTYYTKNLPVVTDIARESVVAGQKKFYNKCDLTLVPTVSILEELSAYGFDINKMVLWQRGIDHTIFNQKANAKPTLRSIVHNHYPILLFASRLVWEKNLDTLIEIYKEIKSRDLDFNLVIVGDGSALDELKDNMPDAHFTGKVNQSTLAGYYAESDVFLFPSISETYGSVVAETMACGCPAVVGDGGGSASLVDHGINGFRCPPNEAECYIDKAKQIINDPKLQQKIVKNGLQFSSKLDWNYLTDQYFEYVDNLANRDSFKRVS